jgi:hypothetical protein
MKVRGLNAMGNNVAAAIRPDLSGGVNVGQKIRDLTEEKGKAEK